MFLFFFAFSMPLQVNSEFYPGWLDHWGDKHAMVDAQKVSRVLGEMLTMGANVNMYVSPNIILPRFPPLCTGVVKHNGCHCPVFCLIVSRSYERTSPLFLLKTQIWNFKQSLLERIFWSEINVIVAVVSYQKSLLTIRKYPILTL